MDGLIVYTSKTLVTIHPSRVECVTVILVGVAAAAGVAAAGSMDCVGGGDTCCCCFTRKGFRLGHIGDRVNFLPHDKTLHRGTQTNQYTNVMSIITKGRSTEHVKVM